MFIMFHLDIETQKSVTRGFISFFLVSAENLEFVKIDRQIKSLIFASHQSLDRPKVPKYAFASDFSRHAKSSLMANIGFFSSTKVAIRDYSLQKNLNGNIYPLRCWRLTSDSPRRSRNIFQFGVSRLSNRVSAKLLT